MAQKKTTKTTRRAAKQTTKQAEVPVQPDDSQELVVFAFRLTRAERDLIHRAAGPAKASKLARTLLVAVAQKDAAAVKKVMKGVNGKP